MTLQPFSRARLLEDLRTAVDLLRQIADPPAESTPAGAGHGDIERADALAETLKRLWADLNGGDLAGIDVNRATAETLRRVKSVLDQRDIRATVNPSNQVRRQARHYANLLVQALEDLEGKPDVQVDNLGLAGKVFSLAGNLGRAFREEWEAQSRRGHIDPASWDQHAQLFRDFCDAIPSLQKAIQNPPAGFAPVAEQLIKAARVAKQIRDTVQQPHGRNEATYLKFFPELNSIWDDGWQTIKQAQKSNPPVDPLAFADMPAASDTAKHPLTSLSDFPATPAGHLDFLERVRDEVHFAAEAKRQQFAKEYPNATLAKMVSGIKWAEAAIRLAELSALPAPVVEGVARILRRELKVGTIDQIDELLGQPVRSLRNAFEEWRSGGLEASLDAAVAVERAEKNERDRQHWISLGMPADWTYEQGEAWAKEKEAQRNLADQAKRERIAESERLPEIRCKQRLLAAGYREEELTGGYYVIYLNRSDPRYTAYQSVMEQLKAEQEAMRRALGCEPAPPISQPGEKQEQVSDETLAALPEKEGVAQFSSLSRSEHLACELLDLLSDDVLRSPRMDDLKRHEHRVFVAIFGDFPTMTPDYWEKLSGPEREPYLETTIARLRAEQQREAKLEEAKLEKAESTEQPAEATKQPAETAPVTPPMKQNQPKGKRRISKDEANLRARDALKGKPTGGGRWTVRKLAKAVGCSAGLVNELSAWLAHPDREAGKSRKAKPAERRSPLSLETVAAVKAGGSDDPSEIAAASELGRMAGGNEAELQRLIAEQSDDFEPSPLTPAPPRKRESAK
ncbi:MAG TPA: hypothetical protein VHY91_09560 [Pirellulales bacterium]|jgi:hypothetical protein|nr:hypothetical protein [Pirellulales bacterium]